VNFNRSTLSVDGFVDLGEFTPKDGGTKLADHALVFMFRPLCGSWVQTIRCFLTKGNATLSHLLLEAVTLLENAGLRVDGVVCDGATWNRMMWKKFGIDANNSSCEHPTDPTRRLWFFFGLVPSNKKYEKFYD